MLQAEALLKPCEKDLEGLREGQPPSALEPAERGGEWCRWGWRAGWLLWRFCLWPESNGIASEGLWQLSGGTMYVLWANQNGELPLGNVLLFTWHEGEALDPPLTRKYSDHSLVLLLIMKALLSVIQVMVTFFFSVHTLPLFVTFPEALEKCTVI